jgi:V/A-type H+-transporting ATPase subunit A
MEKQFKMMEIILYLYKKSKVLVTMGMPMSVLKEDTIFEKIIAIKYDIPNDKLELFDDYRKAVDEFYDNVLKRNG